MDRAIGSYPIIFYLFVSLFNIFKDSSLYVTNQIAMSEYL